jgi:hypothetical protein
MQHHQPMRSRDSATGWSIEQRTSFNPSHGTLPKLRAPLIDSADVGRGGRGGSGEPHIASASDPRGRFCGGRPPGVHAYRRRQGIARRPGSRCAYNAHTYYCRGSGTGYKHCPVSNGYVSMFSRAGSDGHRKLHTEQCSRRFHSAITHNDARGKCIIITLINIIINVFVPSFRA